MPQWPMAILGLCLSLGAHAQGITAVLRQSQQRLLEALPLAAAGPRADTVQRSFEQLCQALGIATELHLRVVTGPVVAEAMLGHVVLANETLADAPEGARLFILAHEIGHLVAQDWQAMNSLYLRWIPGEVTPAHTDPVANDLGREASALAHQQELAADAYALHSLRRLGWHTSDAVEAFLLLGRELTHDTATHPSTRRRLALLRGWPSSVLQTDTTGL
ncbi:MAG: M48 family metalloprotease [Vitreoscilla sp.]|nr:M48 family metalloprotease [Burkholderiales bacterium]MBP6338332.1 M48 family metalloprotease [Vitreoscilla sp.]MBP6674933.1 M48 family metalloprotease [Vitreoscilla sp.]